MRVRLAGSAWAAMAGAVVILTVGGVMSGCGASRPAGTDGDLVDDWPPVPAASPFHPAEGVCHEDVAATESLAEYRPVDCVDLHRSETFHVGATGDAAVPPPSGSAAAREAYADCDRRAGPFLGGPWRDARIALRVVWPSRAAWSGGSRWYRCDAVQADFDGRTASRSSSLAGALRDSSDLRLGCFEPAVRKSTVSAMRPVGCGSAHHAEYAGLWTAPEVSYAEVTGDQHRAAAGCRTVIARFTGVPDDDDVQYRVGWISYHPTKPEWQQGERRVRCFLWFRERTLTRSLKDAGAAALPIN
ncbi:septum formation family protein [Mangrovihabitans endophyticus]|uniref:Septum formation-related domain-containing protein n=1 Tax=Mangrovihabitans endophyticus TaxID=1751298 RepID=A0A8J3FR70_9ACTN|nr:septum formation family protein [Mangrovihabitans endophyticus]GGL13292.1 hypothetical protein GCM10012284_54990 [Mangrovihabitans endophyticus]